MNITLAQFQIKAIRSLFEAMENDNVHNITLKSPTGSGKTIILTHFMDEYLKGCPGTVFVWLTPGKGNLEEQSKAKMDKYIHGCKSKLLADVMTEGFEENDCCFLNWEKLTKKDNNALKDSERTNFYEWISKALQNGLKFKVIIDESHANFTEKSDAVVQLFHTDKIIRCSATPLPDRHAKLIEITEDEVIAEGLIKKMLVINEDFPQKVETENQTQFLLEKAMAKQRQLRKNFLSRKVDVNPLVIVQLPNKSDALLDTVESFFKREGISYGVWLSERHDNLDAIEKNDSPQEAVIIKQAVATGWDCPRASILVKLRENMDETFEIQTIGRIRRMPEAKHYGDDELDSCYLYTFDGKFTEGVKSSLGKGALEAKTLFLKNQFKKIVLVKEQRTMVADMRDPRRALKAISLYFKNQFKLSENKSKNQTLLQASGFEFSEDIVRYTLSGKAVRLSELTETERFNAVKITEKINTHHHGRDYHNRTSKLGFEIGLDYNFMNAIIGKLFSDRIEYSGKILAVPTKQLYAFVINNFDNLKAMFKVAMVKELEQLGMQIHGVSKKEFFFPRSIKFTYNSANRVQKLSAKNVYDGYLLSAEPRSASEKKFEKFCANTDAVDWFYKNGDKGEEYLSICYLDNSNKQRLFYPDYVISVRGEIWIIETKGGFDSSGASQDIDIASEKKFEELKRYIQENQLKGGFVRFDQQSDELFICRTKYNDDIHSDSWELLSEVIK